MARDHAAYFRALALDPEVERALSGLYKRSLEDCARLERDRSQTFEQYLAAYAAGL